MIHFVRPSIGLVGRILVILLLTVTVEFCTSTLLYERASEFSLREDEAHRLAEHLVITRKLIAERPDEERPTMASLLTTERYDVRWNPSRSPPAPLTPALSDMQRQIIAWEPSLADSDLRLSLKSPGRNAIVTGSMTLSDGSWISFGTREVAEGWDMALGPVILALIPALGLLVIGSLLIRQTLKPIKMLAQAAERYGYGDRVILPETGSGEILRVTRAFNEMQDRIHRLLSDRTRALAAVGHDLRTPIARLQLRLDMVRDSLLRDGLRKDANEMEAMIGSLLTYLGGNETSEAAVRVDVVSMATTLVDDAQDAGHNVQYQGPESLDAVIRLFDIKRAMGNLLSNALRYGKQVVLSVETQGDRLLLRVADDGPGIPEELLDDAKQPFTRLDQARERNTEGLGLGLAIVDRIVQAHAGTLTLSNGVAGGLVAEINLPIAGPR